MMTNSWLQRLHAGLFAIPFGLFTLSGAWHRAIGFGWDIAEDISTAILNFSFVLWVILLLLYLAKLLRHPTAVLDEYLNPVQGALMALLPLSILMFVILLGQPDSVPWLALTLFALALQLAIAARVVSILSHGEIQQHTITPALYLPTVAGAFMGAIAMAVLGYSGWGALFFGMGLAAWALLEARVLNRLFHGFLPETLRPIIGIEMAPPAAATLAAGAIWPGLPGEVLIVGLGIASGPVLTVFLRYRLWHKVPFAVGFWSFSFPMAAFAGAMVEVVRRGHWPALVGGLSLLMASIVIAFLLYRTVILLFNGQLLPPGISFPSSKQQG
jgi:tellurite resistance protein